MSSTYQNTVFLNLPVSDLSRSISFYTALGFVQNKTFSDPNAAMMSLPPSPDTPAGPQAHEGPFKIMLTVHSFYSTFLPKEVEIGDPKKVAQCIICVGRESREAVDAFVKTAAENGGRKDIREKTDAEREMEKMGMYGGVVTDLDGHILEVVYMPQESYVGKE